MILTPIVMPDGFAAILSAAVFMNAGIRAEIGKEDGNHVVWVDSGHPEFSAVHGHVHVCLNRFANEALELTERILFGYVAWRRRGHKPTTACRAQDN